MQAKFDPDISIYANWEKADPLDSAWFLFAPIELMDQYRDCGTNPSRSAILKIMMQGEVRDKLSRNDAFAFGIQTDPAASAEPLQIPLTMFASKAVKIDWDNSIISGLKFQFEDVRICLGAGQERPIKPISNTVSNKRGGERPSLYPKARIILDNLFSNNPSLSGLSAEKISEIFNREFQKRFANPATNVAPVSVRALRDYLKRYRQEMAETGNNQ